MVSVENQAASVISARRIIKASALLDAGDGLGNVEAIITDF
jgi:hypothetical protein